MGVGYGIREKPIPDPGSRSQKGTGSRIQICNTVKINAQKLANRKWEMRKCEGDVQRSIHSRLLRKI
jgi:hypothetical protein